MKTTKLWAVLLMAILPLTVACGREGAETDDADDTATTAEATAGEQEQAGVDAPGDLNPVEAQMAIDDVTLGHSVGADGTIAADQQGDDFSPGQPVHLSMEVGDTPAGSAVKVVWYGPGETKIGETTETVDAGVSHVSFQSADTASWQKGDYRAEVWIGDEKVNTQQFQIVDSTEAGR